MSLVPDKFKQVDDIQLLGIVEEYLDQEASEEFAELERRFWVNKITLRAAQQGLTLHEFFAHRIGDALNEADAA